MSFFFFFEDFLKVIQSWTKYLEDDRISHWEPFDQ